MAAYYPRQSSLKTGLRCACPRCGQGKLYTGLLTVREGCSVCDFDYGRLNTDDGAAFFIIVLYSALILPLAAWFQFALEPPVWVHFLVWIPVIVVGAIALMRPFKAWLVAQQFKHNVDDADITRFTGVPVPGRKMARLKDDDALSTDILGDGPCIARSDCPDRARHVAGSTPAVEE